MDAQEALLIVENDSDMRQLLADALYYTGCRLVEAGNAYEAFDRIKECRPRLILTDLRMPGGGLTYLAQLKKQVPDATVIVLTAFGDIHTKHEALKLGAHAYFDKPVRLAELRKVVDEALVQSQETPGAPVGPPGRRS
ncbi:response regulator [Candidatus Nitrospira bockiana]